MSCFFRIFVLISVMVSVLSADKVYAQRKFNGRTNQIEERTEINSLFWAGVSFKETNLKFKGSDTLQNGKIVFLHPFAAKRLEFKCEIIVENGIMVQFQINVNTQEMTTLLQEDCEVFYGKPKKNSSTKSNQMFVWEKTNRNGKRISTVLITGNKNKKAELVSWQL